MISTRLTAQDFWRLHPVSSIPQEMMFSNTARIVENAAKNINKKNRLPQSLPSGIWLKNIRQGDKNQAWSGSLVNMERKACRKNDKSGGDSNKCIQNGNIYRFTKQRAFLSDITSQIAIAPIPRLNVKNAWFMAPVMVFAIPICFIRSKSGIR